MRSLRGVLLLGILASAFLFGQFSGRIAGSVVDTSGGVIANAAVELYVEKGVKPLLSTKTDSAGDFNFNGVRPAAYELRVQFPGFATHSQRIVVDAARETSVPRITLEVGATANITIDVTADVQGIQFSNAEVANTVAIEQIQNLPILGRDPLGLLQLQPGVVYNGNSTTTINGLRTSYSDVTLDGINIQDNYIRDNALDYSPTKLLLGQVQQVTIVSSNVNAAASGGATQTAFSTNSGTNRVHGNLLWYNRNNALAANDWFNNQSGVALPFLNQNHFGGSLSGPIRKDKVFYYFNYEAVRAHQQSPQLRRILTADAAKGLFTYRDSVTGQPRPQVDLLKIAGLTGIDPTVQALLARIPSPSQANTNLVGDGVNTAGYRFNMRNNETRDNLTGKIDYSINTRHALGVSYLWSRDNTDRPEFENDFSTIPKAMNPTHTNFMANTWRWTPAANITNEFRFGFNAGYGYFFNNENFGSSILTGLVFSNPVNTFQPQGRSTNTFTLADDAAWQHGRHNVMFGFHMQNVRVHSWDRNGVTPGYSLGMGYGQQAYNLTRSKLPGITDNDLNTANALLATLGGLLDSSSQTFNITSRNSGYVPGAPFVRNFLLDDMALYAQDNWRIRPTLTLTLGLRYALPGVADERDSLELLPVWTGGAATTVLSNATLDYAGKSAGRPWYKRSWKSFAPSIGFAWDVGGHGSTSIRGGYALSYVNDQEILAVENMLEGNGGLQGFSQNVGLSGKLSDGLPAIAPPPYAVPTTVAANYASNPYNTVTTVDPNLHRPYVQQYHFGIQHRIFNTVFEARYVGNHVVGAYRAFDYNQVELNSNGFLPDFLRARANGFLAQSLGRGFNPAFSAITPGSQQLTVLPLFSGRGNLGDPNVVYYLETGQPGELATYYQTNGLNPNNLVRLFANRYALGADMLTNYSSASYNSLQIEARHRLQSGVSFSANYTFSKVLSDGDGDLQSRFQAFLDLNNPKLERSRANFDQTHMIKANGYYTLPFGEGRRWSYKPLDRLLGGWTVGAVMLWQSGAPFSILSSYATLNRDARSYYNGANTSLGGDALKEIVHFQMTGYGPLMVAPSAFNPADGTGVAAPGDPAFTGQVFFNPDPGTLGQLQRRRFSGPWLFNIDLNVAKVVKITERQTLEVRAQAYNAPNHPSFWAGDQNINSSLFGAVAASFSPRIIEFGALFKF